LWHKLDNLLIQAIRQYGLIEDNDRILIGVSGGKDSLALIDLLSRRMRIFKPRFSVVAAHITMKNISYQSDLSYLKRFSEERGVPFVTVETEFDASTDKRKSPCFLCSWTRRKRLFDLAKQYECNKIALGHHQDDILHTLLLNMTFQGAFSTMPPKLKMNKFDMTIIRPLCLIPEAELINLSAIQNYQLQIKNCPYEKESHRSDMKSVFAQIEKLNPQARFSLWKSMTNIQSDYLPKEEII
jgi:tRNA(Ile)-lysidine synthase TilS/MesJ